LVSANNRDKFRDFACAAPLPGGSMPDFCGHSAVLIEFVTGNIREYTSLPFCYQGRCAMGIVTRFSVLTRSLGTPPDCPLSTHKTPVSITAFQNSRYLVSRAGHHILWDCGNRPPSLVAIWVRSAGVFRADAAG